MTTPGRTGYLPLEPVVRTPSELVERALLDVAVKTPDWEPKNGHTALVLMEALALIAAEIDYAANRAPERSADEVFARLGIERGLGTTPTASIAFSVSAPTGSAIAAGTRVRLDLGDGSSIDFVTDAPVAVPPGAATVTAAATGTSLTSAANGTPAGTSVEVISGALVIDSAVLESAVTAGSDPEDDFAWRSRGVLRFSRLTSTLVAPKHFEAEAEATEGVARARAIDNFDGAAPAAGHTTVAVIGAAGALLSPAAKEALHADLDMQAQANLIVHVIDATITEVPVTTVVQPLPGYDAATVEANVQAVLDSHLNSDVWLWGDTVRRNELIAQIDRAAGVDYVDELTVPAADVPLPGAAPLAALGVLTVTVL